MKIFFEFDLFHHTTILKQQTLKTYRQKYGKSINKCRRIENFVAKGEMSVRGKWLNESFFY